MQVKLATSEKARALGPRRSSNIISFFLSRDPEAQTRKFDAESQHRAGLQLDDDEDSDYSDTDENEIGNRGTGNGTQKAEEDVFED